jgi:DNA polymerase-1
MNKRYLDMIESIDTKEEVKPLSLNDRVLVIDSLNAFIRSFAVIRHLNPKLVPIGGLTGYLRSLGYAMNLVRPTRVILVFDGKGSSTNKKYIYPEYKANRGLSRITNWDIFDSHEEESEALKNQIVRLIDYLRCLPVDIVSVDKIEADDVIGHLANIIPGEVTIVSSDKDYLQLVSPRVTVFSPTKKIFYTPEVVLKEYGIHPRNFLLHKMLLGDGGDNVPGVIGLGPKTLLKEFPEFGKEMEFTLDEVIEKCEDGGKKVHQSIINFKHQIVVNKLLMDLHNPNIPEESVEYLRELIDNPNKGFYPQEFQKLYDEDELGNSISNLQSWLYTNFNELSKSI